MKKLFAVILTGLFLPTIVFGADTGWKSPTELGIFTQWSYGANAYLSDDNYASASASGGNVKKQDYKGFNFNIPRGCKITGVEAKIEHYETSVNTDVIELAVDFNDRQRNKKPNLSLTETTQILGGVDDKWGKSLTAESFTDENFYFDIALRGWDTKFAYLDNIKVKIHYIGILPVENTIAQNSLAFAGRLFTDLTPIILLVIGLPVGFFALNRSVSLIRKRFR